MYNLNLAFEKELRKLITEEIERVKDHLASGAAINSYESYKQLVGRIAGLNMALELCEEASTLVSKSY